MDEKIQVVAKGTEPYGKHQLYKGDYEMSKGGEIKPPDECRWVVRKYQSGRMFSPDVNEPGEIALILEEDYPIGTVNRVGTGFWPVISFLTPDEAKHLGKQLLNASR